MTLKLHFYQILVLALSLLSFEASSSPHPGLTTNPLVGPERGKFVSPLGFSIHAERTQWVQKLPPKSSTHIKALYLSPREKGQTASLTIRVDRTKQKMSLKSYVRSFMKDYSRFGFDVLAQKAIRINGYQAHLVDIHHRDSKKQIRQVLFPKGKQFVFLTCRDQVMNFQKSIESCNQLVKNFRWL